MIDAHHHIWRLDHTPWLQGPAVPRIFGEYEPLRRDYSIEDFAANTRGHGVRGSVYVQVNVAPGQETEEIAWATSEGERAGLVQATVAYADLGAPGVGELLDRHAEVASLRGIRQQLHWHADPAYRFASRPDVALDPDWQRGLRELTARDLLFELQVFPSQFGMAEQLVDAHPEQRFVLLHAGMPDDRSPLAMAAWRAGLQRLAARENLWVKLSGLGTFVRRCTVEDWGPVIEATLDAFGPSRCLFGSNFPIERLWTSYDHLVEVVVACLADLTPHERHDVLTGVASRLYRLSPE